MILETALMCMAFNIYHEANNQSMLGQIAVGQVVMNRVEDSRFPDTVCEVVKQAVTYKGTDKPVLHKCQFSWYCDGQKDDVDMDSRAWSNALENALIVLGGKITIDFTDGATHYHATYVRPAWRKTKTKTTRIDRHIFYRWEK
jgi:spore germination cell wall hydrolase CwlJ-like protein|tara:strand:- start:624 stop:1052 length:429 start_codon:yes stop_codon:yes gene_type:complete